MSPYTSLASRRGCDEICRSPSLTAAIAVGIQILRYVILQPESTDSKVTCYSSVACWFRISPRVYLFM